MDYAIDTLMNDTKSRAIGMSAMDVLIEAIQQVSCARDLTSIRSSVILAARKLVNADGATFVLKENDQCYYADEDAIAPLWKGSYFPMENCIAGWSMRHRRTVAIKNVNQDPRIRAGSYNNTFVTSLVIVPIRTLDPVGTIGVYWAKSFEADTDDIKLLQALASCVSGAMSNVETLLDLNKKMFKLTSESYQMRLQAEKASAIKSRFLAATSHDLRQPLQQLGALGAIIAHSTENLDIQNHARKIQTVVNGMEKLLNTLLDLNKLENGSIPATPQDLTLQTLLNTLQADFDAAAAAKHLQLIIFPTTSHIHSDPDLLLQILRNVLGNAIKYTQHGSVHVHCTILGGGIDISISDTGPGVAKDQQLRIFEPFYRLDKRQPNKNSVGLGLSIVKDLAELLNHPLTLESKLGQGSTFTVRVPRSKQNYNDFVDSDVPALIAPNAYKATILYLEDDEDIVAAMEILLSLAGYRVTCAETRLQALQMLNNDDTRPDIIITDSQLADGEQGLEVVQQLRTTAKHHIPAIMLTGYTETAMTENALKTVQQVLRKPVDADYLFEVIDQLLVAKQV